MVQIALERSTRLSLAPSRVAHPLSADSLLVPHFKIQSDVLLLTPDDGWRHASIIAHRISSGQICSGASTRQIKPSRFFS
jgi:hypothetical protein